MTSGPSLGHTKAKQRNCKSPVCVDSQQVSILSVECSQQQSLGIHIRECGLEEQEQIVSLGPVNQRAGYTHGSHYTYAFDSSLENFHTSRVFGSLSAHFTQDSNSYNTLAAKPLHIDVTVSAKNIKTTTETKQSSDAGVQSDTITYNEL